VCMCVTRESGVGRILSPFFSLVKHIAAHTYSLLSNTHMLILIQRCVVCTFVVVLYFIYDLVVYYFKTGRNYVCISISVCGFHTCYV
jgi:hypothetical protein